MKDRTVDVLGSAASSGDKDARLRRGRSKETVLCESQSKESDEGFGFFPQRHADREDNELEGFFHHISYLGIRESHPQMIGDSGMVNLGGEASNEADPFVSSTRVEKLLEVCPGRLNIHVKEGNFHLRILVSNRFNQAEGIGATDLGTIEVSSLDIEAFRRDPWQ